MEKIDTIKNLNQSGTNQVKGKVGFIDRQDLNIKGIKVEKSEIDYNNPIHLKIMLEDSKTPIDLMKCILGEFTNTTFGSNTEFNGKVGGTLLINFGSKKRDSENMVALLNFVGIEREYQKENQAEQEKLKQSLEVLLKEVADKNTKNEQAKKLGEIMSLLPENACDILFKYHPECKGLGMEYAKSEISKYLGDFLLVKKTWETEDIKMVGELFSDGRFSEALFLKFKDASFAFFQKEKKVDPQADEYSLLMSCFQNKDILEAAARIPELQETIKRLQEYYKDIFALADKKPANIVDILKEGRVFPDINQLINIKEITANKKMLIADDMGLGKSASAVLAKEYLGLKCAVVITPSNVEDTWRDYLSAKVSKGGKQVGYFKEKSAPKVLVIENKKDLRRLETEVFDYVLISQEKVAGQHYEEALSKVDFDMMIVDEVHKLKNITKGVRSKNVVKLAEKIKGEDKYLALLSGTPIPNKVKDLAIILKLLYPEKYEKYDDNSLVKGIIYGDLFNLREGLFLRTQMKELAASIEMPPLFQEKENGGGDIEVELSAEEKEVYEILLEEDELTAMEKIIIFRQFLLNPELLGMEPGFEGSKVKALRETLASDLKTKNKIIVFVNSYIDGVIKGENNIIDKIRNGKDFPKDVVISCIHGDPGKEGRKKIKEGRKKIEAELKTSGGRMIVFVSGQTADVGVDFSGADEQIFYNEPWSNYEKKQQIGRSYREGLKGPLTVKTLIAKGTIEEGIGRYAKAKEKAIEKLLRGIPRTRAENLLLKKDSESSENDVETNDELSKEYSSNWSKLMSRFGECWESGEKWFRDMSEAEKKLYNELYIKMGGLTYQGNNARVTASLIARMMNERLEQDDQMRVLDVASGPEMLKRHASEELRGRLYSLDINEMHFEDAIDKRRSFLSSFLDLPVKNNSVDYYNMGFAFHQTKRIKFHKKNYERLQVFVEMNRVLKVGGRAIVSEIHNAEFVNFDKFGELLERLGFKIIKEYSGEADGGENYRANLVTLEKTKDIQEYDNAPWNNGVEKEWKSKELGKSLDKELLRGLEIKKSGKKSRLKDQRRMIDKFSLDGRDINVSFNQEDKRLFSEERKAIREGEALREKYGGVKNIPLDKIKEIGFERKLETPRYYVLYKIIKNGGAVVIRGDYKERKNKQKSSR